MSRSFDTALEQAVTTLLRPLVRLLLKRGVAFAQFAELAKQAYADSAQFDFVVPGRKPTISRVAVLTGLTRKEARRLLQERDASSLEGPRRKVNRAARVVSAWVGDSSYRDGRGGPASLPFEAPAESPDALSFSTLVGEHSGDVTPRAVLDELLRIGAIDRLKDGRLRLVQRSYVPEADEITKIHMLGTDVADLIATIENNIDPDRDRSFFHRKVAYDNLPADYLPLLQALLERKGQRLLEDLNVDMSRHDRDVQGESSEKDRRRAMIGVYYYEDKYR